MQKICTKCKVKKLLNYFHAQKSCNDGKKTWCKECVKEYAILYAKENRSKINAHARRFWSKNKNRLNEKARKKYHENPTVYTARSAAWRKANLEKARERFRKNYWKNIKKARESSRRRYQKWAKKHPEKTREYNDRRRKQQQLATPSWVNKIAIETIYKNRPKGHHVDHIIPIMNRNVCGLHVPWNLQYLPIHENITKKNRF